MTIPRRAYLDKLTVEEKMIDDIIRKIEYDLPADVRLTDAQNLLGAAKDSLSDYIDGIDKRRSVALTWMPISTFHGNPCITILRPHRWLGVVSVMKRLPPSHLQDADTYPWINNDFKTRWSEDEFRPYWMPAPEFTAEILK